MNLHDKLNKEIPKELISWSKWVVAINFSAATGCIIVFKDLDAAKLASIGQFLFGAIVFFVLTVFTAIIFNLLLAMEIKDSFSLKKSHIILAGLQIFFFSAALIFLCLWVFWKYN